MFPDELNLGAGISKEEFLVEHVPVELRITGGIWCAWQRQPSGWFCAANGWARCFPVYVYLLSVLFVLDGKFSDALYMTLEKET